MQDHIIHSKQPARLVSFEESCLQKNIDAVKFEARLFITKINGIMLGDSVVRCVTEFYCIQLQPYISVW